MLRYVYGPDGTKVVGLAVGDQFAGLPSGDVSLDAQSLTAAHPGGRAALCRTIVMSGSFLPTQEEALAHLPSVGKVLTSFMKKWLPDSSALAVVHVSQGKGLYVGQWRLDAHVLATNWDKRTGKALQFNRKQMQSMQAVEGYAPAGLDIQSGRGAGAQVRPRGPLIYPYSKGIEAVEVGRISDQMLEEHIATHDLQTRRRKDGTIISITTNTGRKINIARARAVAQHLDGRLGPSGDGEDIRPQPPSVAGLVNNRSPRANTSADYSSATTHHDVCSPGKQRQVELAPLLSRWARRRMRATIRKQGDGIDLINGYFDRSGKSAPLALYRAPATLLKKAVDYASLVEDIQVAQIIK
jgi:hypothetical protein